MKFIKIQAMRAATNMSTYNNIKRWHIYLCHHILILFKRRHRWTDLKKIKTDCSCRFRELVSLTISLGEIFNVKFLSIVIKMHHWKYQYNELKSHDKAPLVESKTVIWNYTTMF